MRTAKLDDIVRQHDPALKSAVEMLATGQVSAALDALQQQGRVKEIPDRESVSRAIARLRQSPRHSHRSPDNASAAADLAVRPGVEAKGSLAAGNHSVRVLVISVRTLPEPNDHGKPLRHRRRSTLRTRQQGFGIEAPPMLRSSPSTQRQACSRSRNRAKSSTYDPRRLTGVSVYRESNGSSPLATAFNSPRPTNRSALANATSLAIESIHPMAGLISTSSTLPPDRNLTWRHVISTTGDAVTSHSSQGLTAERVLVHRN